MEKAEGLWFSGEPHWAIKMKALKLNINQPCLTKFIHTPHDMNLSHKEERGTYFMSRNWNVDTFMRKLWGYQESYT